MKTLTSGELARLPRRKVTAHKQTAGRVLVIAGSYGMAGAAYLTAAGAYRAGAGYVRVACPEDIYPILAYLVPSAVFIPLKTNAEGGILRSEGEKIAKGAEASDVIAVGPGVPNLPENIAIIEKIVKELQKPTVFDAGALNIMAERRDLIGGLAGCVFTPHSGEMGRLLGIETKAVEADRAGAAARLAGICGGVAVLKGWRTLVSDGERLYENTSGNAGMAKAGAGDCLTGIIAAFMAEGLSAFDSACIGTYIHGRAGDAAAAGLGRGLVADDILSEIPATLLAYEGGRFERG